MEENEKMLELKDFEEAKKRVDEVIIPTPLIYSLAFSKECRNMVYIKPENLQRMMRPCQVDR
mgnify:CR=1 FL=1